MTISIDEARSIIANKHKEAEKQVEENLQEQIRILEQKLRNIKSIPETFHVKSLGEDVEKIKEHFRQYGWFVSQQPRDYGRRHYEFSDIDEDSDVQSCMQFLRKQGINVEDGDSDYAFRYKGYAVKSYRKTFVIYRWTKEPKYENIGGEGSCFMGYNQYYKEVSEAKSPDEVAKYFKRVCWW